MGIYNRDYIREHSPQRGFGGGGTSDTCTMIIVATVIVFVLQLLITRSPERSDLSRFLEPGEEISDADFREVRGQLRRVSVVENWLELDPELVVYRGQIWRLVTNAFCHDRHDIFHILFNMLFLWWFGRTLEAMYGSREFLYFYIAAAVIASIAFVAMALALGDVTPAIGASGAVMGVVMLYAIHYPRQVIYIFFVIPVEMRFLVLLFIAYDLHPVLLELGGDRMNDGIAHTAHLGGLAFGFLYYRYGLNLERLVSRIHLPKVSRIAGPRSKIKVYQPPQESFDEKVDAILEKISREGEASLSDEERETLKDASRRYRKP